VQANIGKRIMETAKLANMLQVISETKQLSRRCKNYGLKGVGWREAKKRCPSPSHHGKY